MNIAHLEWINLDIQRMTLQYLLSIICYKLVFKKRMNFVSLHGLKVSAKVILIISMDMPYLEKSIECLARIC